MGTIKINSVTMMLDWKALTFHAQYLRQLKASLCYLESTSPSYTTCMSTSIVMGSLVVEIFYYLSDA